MTDQGDKTKVSLDEVYRQHPELEAAEAAATAYKAASQAREMVNKQRKPEEENAPLSTQQMIAIAEAIGDPQGAGARMTLREKYDEQFQQDFQKFLNSQAGEALMRSKAEKNHMTYEEYKRQFDTKVRQYYARTSQSAAGINR